MTTMTMMIWFVISSHFHRARPKYLKTAIIQSSTKSCTCSSRSACSTFQSSPEITKRVKCRPCIYNESLSSRARWLWRLSCRVRMMEMNVRRSGRKKNDGEGRKGKERRKEGGRRKMGRGRRRGGRSRRGVEEEEWRRGRKEEDGERKGGRKGRRRRRGGRWRNEGRGGRKEGDGKGEREWGKKEERRSTYHHVSIKLLCTWSSRDVSDRSKTVSVPHDVWTD